MFDNLIRRDPRDSGKTIIPDLAHSWQISKDGKTYTFFLRKDVQFHDGAEFTADDVKATYDRISKPPAGISIPRSILFSSVSEINVRDKHTIEFKLAEPRPANFIMSAFRQRLERHRPQEDAGGQPVQPAPRRRHSGHRPLQEQAPGRERSLGDGAQPELLEQGAALPRRRRVLPRPAVLAGARLGRARRPHGLRAHRRSGHVAQGQGHARHVLAQLLPERDPGHLAQRQEEALRRSARPARRASRVRTGGAGRRGQGRGAHDGRRLHLSVLRVRHARSISW